MFGNIKAIGGNGGNSVSIDSNGNLVNGLGGSIPSSNVCIVSNGSSSGSGKDYTSDNKRCIKGNKGNDANVFFIFPSLFLLKIISIYFLIVFFQ